MRKLLVLVVLASATALAAPFKIKPAGIAAGDVKITKTDSVKTFHYSTVESAYPYIGIKAVKGALTAQAIKDACGLEVRENLKTPGVAKFAKMSSPVYFENAGTYFLGGDVDSQNSYGAMVRSHFYCTIAFEGTAKGGTLYTSVDFSDY